MGLLWHQDSAACQTDARAVLGGSSAAKCIASTAAALLPERLRYQCTLRLAQPRLSTVRSTSGPSSWDRPARYLQGVAQQEASAAVHAHAPADTACRDREQTAFKQDVLHGVCIMQQHCQI